MPRNMSKHISADDLPPPDVKRWVPARKAIVVEAVQIGIISLDEACQRYALSVEEFTSWQRAKDRDGLRGLKARNLFIRERKNR